MDETPEILFIDDHRAAADVFVDRLRRSGFDVLYASTASSALQVIDDQACGLSAIILDLLLPDDEAFHLASPGPPAGELLYLRIRKSLPDVPIVAISVESDLIARMTEQYVQNDPHLLAEKRVAINPEKLALLLGGKPAALRGHHVVTLAPVVSTWLPSKHTLLGTAKRSKWVVLIVSTVTILGEFITKALEHGILSWLNDKGPFGAAATAIIVYTQNNPYSVYIGVLVTYSSAIVGYAQYVEHEMAEGKRHLERRPVLSFEYLPSTGGFGCDAILIGNAGELALDIKIKSFQVMLDMATFDVVEQLDRQEKRVSRIHVNRPGRVGNMICSYILDEWLEFLSRPSIVLEFLVTYCDRSGKLFWCRCELEHSKVRNGPTGTSITKVSEGMTVAQEGEVLK